MRMTTKQITALAQKIKDDGNWGKTHNPQYDICTRAGMIDLYTSTNHLYTAPTAYLSDIHAILRQCHPSEAYSITLTPFGLDTSPYKKLYIYRDQPSTLSISSRTPAPHGRYMLNTQHIDDTDVSPDEKLHNAEKRASKHIMQQLDFITKSPDIHYGATSLHTEHSVYHDGQNNITMNIIIDGTKGSNQIQVNIAAVCNGHHSQHTTYLLPATTSAQASQEYTQKFAQTMDALIRNATINSHINLGTQKIPQDIADTMISNAQHYLTDTNSKLFHDIQRCMDILRDHYVHVGTPPYQFPPPLISK